MKRDKNDKRSELHQYLEEQLSRQRECVFVSLNQSLNVKRTAGGQKRVVGRNARDLHTVDSVQFSRSVVSDSLRPHELQHARPPFPSPAPGVYSKSCPLS